MDIAALIISLLAVGISGFTFYFNHFHKKVSIVGALVSTGVAAEEQRPYAEHEYSLSNTGNQELVVRDFLVEASDQKLAQAFPTPTSKDLPVVIRPGEVKLVRLKVSIPKTKEDHRDTIVFRIFAPNGKSHFLRHNIRIDEDAEDDPFGGIFVPFELKS